MDWQNISFNDEVVEGSSDSQTDENNNISKLVDDQIQQVSASVPGTSKSVIMFNCNVCPYNSRSRGNLYRHKKVVHKKEKVQCDSCTKEFSQKYDLERHRKSMHQNVKLMCEVCSKCFNTRFSPRRHRVMTNTGEAKYQCAVCSKKFYEKGNYLGHLNNHVKAKPYSCTICKNGFAFKYSQKRHMLGCGKHGNAHISAHCVAVCILKIK